MNNKVNFKYNNAEKSNSASLYTNKLVKSDFDRTNGGLINDVENTIKGGCTYIPNFFCKTNDFTIFDKIMEELSENKIIIWSKHKKYENPEISKTFQEVVKKMAEYFNVNIMQTRLNYYEDESDWKCLHKDRHAYGKGENKIREDFTMGASFGHSRNLEFVHDETKNKFSFPQNNGDVFAFDSDINKKFMHCVPKEMNTVGPRISIIAWGKKN